jgi:two-component system response regulator FixJ
MSDWIVFVVDDDDGVRNGLNSLLRTSAYAVETFSSATAFLAAYDRLQRGCLLLDVRMPHMTGLELQQELKRRGWSIFTIFITGHATVSSAVAALGAGAFDFIEKCLRDDALIESIARARGQEEMTHQERLQLVEIESRARAADAAGAVIGGEPNKIFARRLGISFRTVEIYRSHILEKMQARTLSDPHGVVRASMYGLALLQAMTLRSKLLNTCVRVTPACGDRPSCA